MMIIYVELLIWQNSSDDDILLRPAADTRKSGSWETECIICADMELELGKPKETNVYAAGI